MASDNTNIEAKIEIRKFLIKEVENPCVLDCYAGYGNMAKICYSEYEYFGLEKRHKIEKLNIIKTDNIKWIKSNDISKYNVFDLDAYGCPLSIMEMIVNKSRADTMILYLTFSFGGFNTMSSTAKRLNGIDKSENPDSIYKKFDKDIFLYGIKSIVKTTGYDIIKWLYANNKKHTHYSGILIKRGQDESYL